MKSRYRSFGRIKAEKLGCSALFACLLITLLFITILKQTYHPFPSLNLQLSKHTYMPYPTVKESPSGSFTEKETDEMTKLALNHEEEEGSNLSASVPNFLKGDEGGVSKQVIYPEKLEGIHKIEGNGIESLSQEILDENNQSNYTFQKYPASNSSQAQNYKKKSDIGQEGWLACDLSEARSDTCSLFGDVRVLSSSYTILLATSSASDNYTHIIKPYARKWEPQSMQNIKELFLKTSIENSACNLKHEVPAIIFSTGGFLGNFFHDFTDVLIPLFITSHQFNRNVQFLVTDFNAKWITKYRPILQGLSRFEIVNMDIEESIHCFPYIHVGLKSHKVLGIDPSKTPKGYSMTDFKKFLRKTFSLKRGSITQKHSRRKPRLLMILRKGSRSIVNEKQVIMMARRIGYKVITARPEDMNELPRFAEIVNSCDVMMGVHGAGLANMVFLPENSTVIQIIPLGGLTWACRHDYGEPAPDMGIKYLEYEITDDESSLIKQYPRDHAVFRDPLSIHRQGWNQLWSIFLDKQKVKLDVGRFRGLLFEVYQSVKQ